MRNPFLCFFLLTLITGCAAYARHQLDQRYGSENPARFDQLPPENISTGYERDVKPILDSRCVVCHACYDAPCQLQLGSYQGITRGANRDKVYNAARLLATEPTRLFFDAQTNADWRTRGFQPVLNERKPSAEANREASVLARMLLLKHDHEFPTTGLLAADRFDFSLDRDQQCPAIEEFDHFADQHPEWGMPYGLPALSNKEQQTLLTWLENGAPAATPKPLAQDQLDRINQWEDFLNGESKKSQLMSRYIFEHWFLAHLYFDDLPVGDYFELVRSKTPPGEPIQPIASRRPFDDPGVERVYYRLRPLQGTLVAKTHMPYALNAARMTRLKGWFVDEPYEVTSLPSYDPAVAANPFVAFEQLPVRSRYRLMLDEAQFTVMGFIKGPVCRGQVALNVISDYFWIGFVHPDHEDMDRNSAFLAKTLRDVQLPIEQQSNARLLKWINYSHQESAYLRAKSEYLNRAFSASHPPTLADLWDGDGVNQNAALTVFRHYDSASVVQGLIGDQPQTALLVGYPLLERIHYLLVAGFDVYGNTAHQLEARLYMDFLRMEGEFNFLALLPKAGRNSVRDFWYRNAPDDVKAYLNGSKAHFNQETGIAYHSRQPWPELLELWKQYLAPVQTHRYDLTESRLGEGYQDILKQLADLRGKAVSYLPESSFLTVRNGDGQDHHFTLIRNSAHSNISELFKEEERRLPDEDTLTLVNGFVGAYPNTFFLVQANRLSAFVKTVGKLKSEDDYAALSARFSIRRTDERFWTHSDALHAAYSESAPVEAALFDYNRFENR